MSSYLFDEEASNISPSSRRKSTKEAHNKENKIDRAKIKTKKRSKNQNQLVLVVKQDVAEESETDKFAYFKNEDKQNHLSYDPPSLNQQSS
jgi:hypothetical protein